MSAKIDSISASLAHQLNSSSAEGSSSTDLPSLAQSLIGILLGTEQTNEKKSRNYLVRLDLLQNNVDKATSIITAIEQGLSGKKSKISIENREALSEPFQDIPLLQKKEWSREEAETIKTALHRKIDQDLRSSNQIMTQTNRLTEEQNQLLPIIRKILEKQQEAMQRIIDRQRV